MGESCRLNSAKEFNVLWTFSNSNLPIYIVSLPEGVGVRTVYFSRSADEGASSCPLFAVVEVFTGVKELIWGPSLFWSRF